jgi:hypothetical protein
MKKTLNNILRYRNSQELIDYIKDPVNKKTVKAYFYHCIKYSYSLKETPKIQNALLTFYQKKPFELDYEKLLIVLNLYYEDNFLSNLFLANKLNPTEIKELSSFREGQAFLRFVIENLPEYLLTNFDEKIKKEKSTINDLFLTEYIQKNDTFLSTQPIQKKIDIEQLMEKKVFLLELLQTIQERKTSLLEVKLSEMIHDKMDELIIKTQDRVEMIERMVG